MDALERFAALVVQAERNASAEESKRLAIHVAEAEREACAKVCEQKWGAAECAAAIRARGEK
jgi:hypothetical protein